MLLALDISGVALISKLYIEFGNGLNIITGETGAGKSIVVDSINLILGSRFGRDIIKKGFDKAEVNAVFDLSSMQIEQLENMGIECGDEQLSITRTINASGKSVCRINGKIVTLTILKQVSCFLMDVHGQHENQVLFEPSNHIDFLDNFIFKENNEIKEDFLNKFTLFKDFRNKIISDKMDTKSINLRLSIIREEISDFEALRWKLGDEERLQHKVSLMENAEALGKAINGSYDLLYGDDQCALERLSAARDYIDRIADINDKYRSIYNSLDNIYYELEETVSLIRNEKGDFDFNPTLFEQMQKKLFDFNKLKKKYNLEEDELIDYFIKLKKEHDELEYNLGHATELKEELKVLYKDVLKSAKALSDARKQGAVQLENEVIKHLDDLGMKNARFSVSFGSKDLTSKGIDNVEFLFCANSGQDLNPLAKVASGGEISRLMLALKNVDLDSSIIDSMVFDEIDTGISGKIAQVVAEKLANISTNNQVICVTHLPQVAAMGDLNLLVAKSENENETIVDVKKLDFEGKIREVARLISGSDISDSGLMHAKKLIEDSKGLIAK